MSYPKTQSDFAQALFEKIAQFLGIEGQPLYKYTVPDTFPIKRRTLEDLKAGNLNISIKNINLICEEFLKIPPPLMCFDVQPQYKV